MPEPYGITATGFNRKRLDEILEDKNDLLKSIFGQNFNTTPQSPDGQVNGAYSESDANLWEIAEICYNAFNPSAATGVTLSNLVQLNGIVRLPATGSLVILNITGTNGTLIPAGSRVSTDPTSGQTQDFETLFDVTIAGGIAEVQARSTKTGPVSALAGTVTIIDTPISGWDTVTNGADAQLGTNEETDVELRARRELSVSRDANSVVDSIFAEVSAVPGVTSATVLENFTDAVDANGLPRKSIQTIVVGGTDLEIAQAIYVKKPAGILPFGDVPIVVTDTQGFPHTISFSRPTEIPIYVIVNTVKGAGYPIDGDDLIKQGIVNYARGLLIEGAGFFLGDFVIHSRLFTPCNLSAPDHDIQSILIGIAPTPTLEDNIVIAASEISVFTTANIDIVGV